MTTKFPKSLLIALLLSAATAHAGNNIEVSTQNGAQQAKFTLGDSRCVLVDEVIRCVPTVVAAN